VAMGAGLRPAPKGVEEPPDPNARAPEIYLTAKQAWRFLQGGSPCRVRPNQPPAPRVAVVEEVTETERDS
jgi:hypothetical protein